MRSVNLISSIICLVAIIACNQSKNNNSKEIKSQDTISNNSNGISLSEQEKCFLAVLKKDSAFLSLCKKDDQIFGRLHYKFLEKDNSKGTLTGSQIKDTINLIYNFSSEGVMSEIPIKLYFKEGKFYEVYDRKISEDKSGFVYYPSQKCVF